MNDIEYNYPIEEGTKISKWVYLGVFIFIGYHLCLMLTGATTEIDPRTKIIFKAYDMSDEDTTEICAAYYIKNVSSGNHNISVESLD